METGAHQCGHTCKQGRYTTGTEYVVHISEGDIVVANTPITGASGCIQEASHRMHIAIPALGIFVVVLNVMGIAQGAFYALHHLDPGQNGTVTIFVRAQASQDPTAAVKRSPKTNNARKREAHNWLVHRVVELVNYEPEDYYSDGCREPVICDDAKRSGWLVSPCPLKQKIKYRYESDKHATRKAVSDELLCGVHLDCRTLTAPLENREGLFLTGGASSGLSVRLAVLVIDHQGGCQEWYGQKCTARRYDACRFGAATEAEYRGGDEQAERDDYARNHGYGRKCRVYTAGQGR